MIKATGRTGDGRPFVLLGLSGENITRLVAGEPIRVDGASLGVDAVIGIVYGKTEQDLLTDLSAYATTVQAAADQ